jgi:flagellar motor switch protein FliN/FliY
MNARNLVNEPGQDATEVSPVELPGLSELPAEGPPLFGGRLDLVGGLKVQLRALVGEGEISVAELFGLKDGSVVPLACEVNPLVELQLDNRTIARGELVVVDNMLGVRITELGDGLA